MGDRTMEKRRYRAVQLEDLNTVELIEAVTGKRVVLGIDIAKQINFGTFCIEQSKVLKIVKWHNTRQARDLVSLLKSLPASRLEVAMESSGTYGDALLHLLSQEGIPTYLVSSKKTHDNMETYDGVPSTHDAKASAIISDLQIRNQGNPWRIRHEMERDFAAALEAFEYVQDLFSKHLNRIEAKLGRHWPEFTSFLTRDSLSFLNLLAHFGSPGEVAGRDSDAMELVRRISRRTVSRDKILRIIECAANTIGLDPTAEERNLIQRLASQALTYRAECIQAQAHCEALLKNYPVAERLSEVVGKITALVLLADVGDPRNFSCSGAYIKALGLNFQVKSSGANKKGQLRITKRGMKRARRYLYLATLRMIQQEEHFAAWHAKKVARDGGKLKMKSVVALMRKLSAGLWHVARGQTFQTQKLFKLENVKA